MSDNVQLTGGSDLQKHVGHRVEIRGHYENASTASGSASSDKGPFRVSSVKMLSSTCSSSR